MAAVRRERVYVVHATPLTAWSFPWRLAEGDMLVAVVKGTFALVAGEPARLAAETDAPSGDRHTGEEPNARLTVAPSGEPSHPAGLVYPSDFAVVKPAADVLVRGTAYAPGGAATAARVSFAFGRRGAGFVRHVAVFGERHWSGLARSLSPPRHFTHLPLAWEGAFGGAGYAPNPVGVGIHADADGSVRLPSFEDPEHLVVSPHDRPPPACLGPVAPTWAARTSKLGSYGRDWRETRWPYFPADFDWSFFQAAPREQQLPYPQGDEPFEASGLHPEHAVFAGKLAGIRPRLFAQKIGAAGGDFLALNLRLDTVVFDFDALRCQVLWRALLPVSAPRAPELAALFLTTEPVAGPALDLGAAESAFHAQSGAIPVIGALLAPPPPRASSPGQPLPSSRGLPPGSTREPISRAAPSVREPPSLRGAASVRAPSARAASFSTHLPEALLEPEPPPVDEEALARREHLLAAGVPEAWLTPDALVARLPVVALPEASAVIAALAKNADREAAAWLGRLYARIERGERARRDVLARRARGESLAGLELDDANLAGLDLAGAVFDGASLRRANLRLAKLAGASFVDALLVRADATGAELEGARLDGADLTDACLESARLRGASLARALLLRAACPDADFSDVQASEARFVAAGLARARFARAGLERADFSGAALDGASFEAVRAPGLRLYDAAGTGVSFVSAELAGARADGVRLAKSSLRLMRAPGSVWDGAELESADCFAASLPDVSLENARCRGIGLAKADVSRGHFRGSHLEQASFAGANAMEASFEAADLRGADLRGANLYGAETWQAELGGARFELANLAGTKISGDAPPAPPHSKPGSRR